MSDANWTILRLLEWTTDFFKSRGVAAPRLDAELLLAAVLGVPRIQLYVRYDQPIEPTERAAFREQVKRRGAGAPVQYLIGQQEFWSIPLEVTPGVLIPRADTEVLVEEALAEAARIHGGDTAAALAIADVGTGSGAIAIALASELPGARVWAGDIADAPLTVAARNAASAGVAERVHVTRADLLAPLLAARGGEPFHVIVSNPPYIREADYGGLMREVRDHEPRAALVGGADGLDVVRRLVSQATTGRALGVGGALLIEIGDPDQAQITAALMSAAGLTDTRIRDDYAARPRVVVGRCETY